MLKVYVSVFQELRSFNNFIQSSIYNIENFLLLNGVDSVEKIDNILMRLESFSEQTQKLLNESVVFNKWYSFPLRYMFKKLDTSNASFQAMLGSQQALMMHNTKNK